VPRFQFSIRRLLTLSKFALKYKEIMGKPGVFRSFLHDSYGGNHRLDSSIWKKDLEISGALVPVCSLVCKAQGIRGGPGFDFFPLPPQKEFKRCGYMQ
jgi:hypothetical protein